MRMNHAGSSRFRRRPFRRVALEAKGQDHGGKGTEQRDGAPEYQVARLRAAHIERNPRQGRQHQRRDHARRHDLNHK